MKLGQGRFSLAIRRFPPRGWLGTGQAPQDSGHSTKPDRVQEAFGQWSQEHGVIGMLCVGPGVGLDHVPDGSLPIQLIL